MSQRHLSHAPLRCHLFLSQQALRNVPARAMDDFVLQIIGEIGRHPDVIKTAIAVSNEEKNKSLRPLKSKLAQLQSRHKELSEELQRFLHLARQPGSDHYELEREQEKVKIDIAYRERVVTDEKLIADALLAFEGTVSALLFEDQRDLLHLLARQVRVNRLDPENAPIPAGPHAWNTQIRTQWYSVNLDFYATDLISKACKSLLRVRKPIKLVRMANHFEEERLAPEIACSVLFRGRRGRLCAVLGQNGLHHPLPRDARLLAQGLPHLFLGGHDDDFAHGCSQNDAPGLACQAPPLKDRPALALEFGRSRSRMRCRGA